ncbi:MAG: ATP-binding cassette domain-containing protein [Clostridia bacterium]|nr:ATP-binding cassette domain-containing protein [Clostridia bacterium]
MIEVKNLFLKYIREYYALYDINLKIEKSERVAFVGDEHSGRTTLLRVIAGLEKFDSGEVFLHGREIRQIDFKDDIQLGYISEVPVFFENKSVYDNLKYVLTERGVDKTEIESKINKALIDFKIEKYKNIKVKDLDLYEKYLLSFIRLSLRELNILLVDNIFAKLSADEAQAFVKLISDVFVCKDVTLIAVCDNFETVKDICTRQIKFVSGSIEQEETAQ